MRIIRDNLHFCADCTCYAANGDVSGCEYEGGEARAEAVMAAVNAFGPHLVAGDAAPWEEGFTCDACGQEGYGYGHTFAVLGPDEWSVRKGSNVVQRNGEPYVRIEAATFTRQDGFASDIVRILNTLPDIKALCALVSELCDMHEADEAEPDTTEHRVLRALQRVQRALAEGKE